MNPDTMTPEQLRKQITELKERIAFLEKGPIRIMDGQSVLVPEVFRDIFDKAQVTVSEYFREMKIDPT